MEGETVSIPEIDPQTRGLVPLRFCEYNHIVPVRLAGRKLTVVAAHPDSYELRTVLSGLRARYDVELVHASEGQVCSIIDANYYGKCELCGEKIDLGRKHCSACRLKAQAQPVVQPIGAMRVNVVAGSTAAVASSFPAGPGLAGKNCPYCQAPIKPGVMVHSCETCGIPHHAECWQHNGGCTTFGCACANPGSTTSTQPQTIPVPQPQVLGHRPRSQPGRSVAVALVVVVILMVAVWWMATAKSREFRADARTELAQLSRIESRLDVGVSYMSFGDKLADVHQSMDEFRNKYETDFGSKPVFQELDEAEKAYVDSLDAWRDKINASEYDDHDYESDMQDYWHKAGEALQRARDELGES